MEINKQEMDFRKISNAVMRCYHESIHEYLTSKEVGTLTDADVAVMIMNLTVGIGTNIYYSLKQILPTTTLDFDYMKAKLTNSLVDSFEKIKEYNPKESTLPLSVEQLKEVEKNGFVIIKMPDGSERRITKDDILVKKEDVQKILVKAKKESTHASPAKIITSSNGILR